MSMTKSSLFLAVPGGSANPHYDHVMNALGPGGMAALCGTMQPAAPKPAPASAPGMSFNG